MIYFFHHYELPAILQQIRIQEMLLQNQQGGQANQTALQDNLNNNHSTAAAPEPGPANTNQPGLQNDPQPPPSALGAPGGGEVRSELNWVAQTAAIIAEALSNEQQPSVDAADAAPADNGAAGGQGTAGAGAGAAGGAGAGEDVVAEFWMGGEDDPHNVSGEMSPTVSPSDPPVTGLQPEEVGPQKTVCPPSQSPGTDWDCRAAEQNPNP